MTGPSTLKELKHFIRRDLKWVGGHPYRTFFSRYLFEPGFRFTVWLRITRYFHLKGKRFFPLFLLARLRYKHLEYKFSFDISYQAQIGPGLTIAHYGYLIVTSNTKLGADCSLKPGVVFGKKLTKQTDGAVIGDNVEFGVGAKIVGDVKIGSNVIVGANAVIVKDVPDNCVVAGVPAKVIRYLDAKEA